MTEQLAPGRRCVWCRGPIPPDRRRDAETCSRACRQARQRFRIAPAAAAANDPLRFAYADPPYPGLSRRYYEGHEDYGGEVDHELLVARLVAEFPHGWALSTSAAALREVLVLCPKDVRVAIWVKGSRAGRAHRARSAYEPVILSGGRALDLDVGEELDDVLVWGGRQHSHPGALPGMKPPPFAEWVFRQLGALAGDSLTDIFTGSGAIMRAWEAYGGINAAAPPPIAPRLPFEDRITAPPVARRRATVSSRLEEAQARISQLGREEEPPA